MSIDAGNRSVSSAGDPFSPGIHRVRGALAGTSLAVGGLRLRQGWHPPPVADLIDRDAGQK